jgi:hypothetical protein
MADKKTPAASKKKTDPVKAYLAQIGRKGGEAGKGRKGFAKGLSKVTPERRREIAALGVAARRAKKAKQSQNSA